MSPTRLAIALVAMVALAIPAPAFAIAEPGDTAAAVTFDTPAPEPETVDPDPKPKKTPKPTKKPQRTPAPALITLPIAPDRKAVSVGYSGNSVLRQAPLLVAELAGYFDAVGLKRVTILRSNDVLAEVRRGDLDFGVVDKAEAAAAAADDPTLRTVAGFRNYLGDEYGGDLLVATPGLVADEPATAIAFLAAYIRALQDFSEVESAEGALKLIRETGLRINADLRADWPAAVSIFAPFDGGFGSIDEDGGLGELSVYLTDADGVEPDLDAFIAADSLSIAQAWSELAANPVNALAGPPGITELTVGMASPDDSESPITTALDAGYFEDAGFESVEIMDVEEPLLGVLQGELDFGVLDAVDAADGAGQGLPLAAIAGHRNYADDGAYGGDILVASADTLGEEGSTASAFLIAYLRALRDLTDEAALAPHDGGFGDREQMGGLGELDAYLTTALGAQPDLEALVESRPLEYAQAWWGLPANPTLSEEAE